MNELKEGGTYTTRVPRINGVKVNGQPNPPSKQGIAISTYRPQNRSTNSTNRIQRNNIRNLARIKDLDQRGASYANGRTSNEAGAETQDQDRVQVLREGGAYVE